MSLILSPTATRQSALEAKDRQWPRTPVETEPEPRHPLREWVAARPVPVLLGTILGVATLLRLVNLNAVGFNSDEAVYAGQGASLAGNPAYTDYFPVFRAHPMLVQTLLSVIYRHGEHDLAGRVLIAAFGVATVFVVYLLGREMYSRNVGLLAAAVLAVMPYHVVVTRQVLLDGPMVFFATVTLLWVAKFAKTGQVAWMLAAGGGLGLTMLSKESSVVLAGSVYAFLALSPSIKRPVLGTILGSAVTIAIFALHPISVALSGHTSTTKAYLVWQLVRRPNHSLAFYAETVPLAVGLLVMLAALVAVWRARRGPAWREVLLASWFLVPAAAFTLWPVKGFQYLLPGAPALAVLAAHGVLATSWRLPWRATPRIRAQKIARGAAVSILLGSLVAGVVPLVGHEQGLSGLAGSGGVAGGREAGRWIDDNTPVGSELLTLGPSMANILQFYGHRKAFGLSVSPNPLKRNPSYVPLANPDSSLRTGQLQYVVWDTYSASRSEHFSEQLQTLARRYHGRVVHREYAERGGKRVPVIIIWEVRP